MLLYIEQRSRTCLPLGVSSFIFVHYFRMTMDDIVAELKSNAKLAVRQEAHKPKRQIQQYFITNQFSELVVAMANWAENNFESDPQFLRLLAHLVLVIRWAGIQHNEQPANLILQKYIEVCIQYLIDLFHFTQII